MSVYGDLKEIMFAVETVKQLRVEMKELRDENSTLKERIVRLEAREEMVAISAREAVRDVLKSETVQEVPSELKIAKK